MPIYKYLCTHCNAPFEAREPVANRHATDCPECGYLADRVFAPTANLIVPAAFKIEANWCLPIDDKGWENRQNPSQSHAPKRETFKEYFEKTYTGDM